MSGGRGGGGLKNFNCQVFFKKKSTEWLCKKKKKVLQCDEVYSGRTPECKMLISEMKFFVLSDFLFRPCDIVVTAKSQESLWHLLAFVHLGWLFYGRR